MAQATNTTQGEILLAGDLYGTDANAPSLVPSGVTPNIYPNARTIHVDSKGRLTWVNGTITQDLILPYIPDTSKTAKGIALAGSTLSVTSATFSVPDGSTTVKGKIQAGTGIDATGGTISINWGSVPDATAASKGFVQVGSNMSVSNGVVSVDLSNLAATAGSFGSIKPGTNMDVDGTGLLSITDRKDATATTKGYVQVGTNINVTTGSISIPDGSTNTKGKLQVGDGLSVSSGVVSLDTSSYATSTVAGVVKTGWSTGVSGSGVMNLALGWAATGVKGAVQIGSGIAVSSGTISLSEPTRKTATASQAGIIKVNGGGFSVDANGLLTFTLTSPPDATSTSKGVIQPGTGFQIISNASLGYAPATASTLGAIMIGTTNGTVVLYDNGVNQLAGYQANRLNTNTVGYVKIGTGLNIAGDGTLSLGAPIDATTSAPGKVQVTEGDGFTITSGTIAYDQRLATDSALGIAKADGTTINVSGAGVVSAVTTNLQLSNTYTVRTKNLHVTPVVNNPAVTALGFDEQAQTLIVNAQASTTYSLPSSTLNTSPPIGSVYKLIIKQSASGNSTFSPSSILGTTINTAANTITYIKYVVVGTNIIVPVEIYTGL